jgi:hypothetical protein
MSFFTSGGEIWSCVTRSFGRRTRHELFAVFERESWAAWSQGYPQNCFILLQYTILTMHSL